MADDISKKILLSIQLDNSELLKRSANTRVELNKLKEEKKQLDKQLASGEIEAGTKEFQDLTVAIEKNAAQQRLLNKEIQANNKVLDTQVKATNAADGSYDQLAAQYNLTKEALNKMSAEERLSTEAGKALQQESANLYEQMKILQEATGKYVLSIGDYNSEGAKAASTTTEYANNLDGLNKKVSDLKKELAGTEIGSQRFEELNNSIKETNLQIQQVQGNVDEFGNKEPKNLVKKSYDDMADAAAGATSAVSLLSVAFGDNQNLQEVQAKLVTGIAVAQGIQNIAKARGAVIDLAATARTKALTIAQATYANVVGKSTGAMKGFKVALAGTGLGAILVLLGELIFNFDAVSKQVNKGINTIRDFTDEVSGGNKIVRGLVEILLLTISPLVTIIRLVSDFNGTITKFQNGINGALDSIKDLVDGIPLLSTVISVNQKAFNFLTNSVKSLGGEQKKFKVDLETLTKVYEKYNAQIERNKKSYDDQIRLAQAQGKSEKELANITRQSLNEMVKSRQVAFQQALDIQAKLIKQNGKLTEEQEKLFLQASDDYKNSQTDLKVFEAEQLRQRNEKYKEFTQTRLQLQRDLQAELNALLISEIEDDQARQQAQLDEQRRLDKENNDARIKDAIRTYGEQSDEVAKLRQIELEQQKIYNTESLNLQRDYDEKLSKGLQEKEEKTDQMTSRQFNKAAEALSMQYELEKQYNNATIKDKQQLSKVQLELALKYHQDLLALTRQFAEQDKVFTDDELARIQDIQAVIDDIQGQINNSSKGNKTLADMIGLDANTIKAIEFGAQQVQSILSTISDVINADAQNRIRAIDDAFNYEKAKIEQSTASQAQKEEKIKELTEKTAKEKYKIELEQFESNKALQITQAAIAGAVSIVQAFAQLGPIAGAISAAVVAGITAAQIAIIANQPPPPPPQFAAGGYNQISHDPQGYTKGPTLYKNSSSGRDFIAGEAGKEWIAPNWMVNHPVYGAHIKAMDDIRVKGYALGGFNNSGGSTLSVNANIDYNTLAAAIASQMAKMPTPVLKISALNKVAGDSVDVSGESRL